LLVVALIVTQSEPPDWSTMRTLQPIAAASQAPISKLSTSLTNHSISIPARALLTMLTLWSGTKGYAWWGVSSMADKLGRSVRSIRYYLTQLEQAGLLLRIPCPYHSNYLIPYPASYTADLQQFMDGSLDPRKKGYDPWSWTPPPQQEELEIPEPERGVQEVAPISRKKELPERPASSGVSQEGSLSIQTKEQPNLFTDQLENMTRGWQVFFSTENQSLMIKVIGHCTNHPVERLQQLWTSLKEQRKGDYIRDIAKEFCNRIASQLLGVGTTYPKRE
jgi:hypothetical protein